MKEPMNNPVVILGGNINGLGIVRSFQETNIPVYVLIEEKDFISHSRFCKTVRCPQPSEIAFVDFLYQFCKGFKCHPVLFATSDAFLLPLIQNKKRLEKVSYIPTCDWEIFSKLIEKRFLYSFASSVGVACPKTIDVNSKVFNEHSVEGMLYPLIIKPSVNIVFRKTFGQKALLVKDNMELLSFIEKVKATGYEDTLIVQEFIPGDMTTLYTITSYADKLNEIRGYSIGHKIRQYPAKTGTITAGLVEHVPAILDMSREFVKKVGFYGISNIEYKYDSRDGQYKLMEINPRTGLWNLSVLESGVNLPLMAYNDILGKTIEDQCNEKGRLIWAITLFDMFVSLKGYRSNGEPEEALSYTQWRKSLKGCRKVDAIFRWNDPIPSLVHSYNLIWYSIKKVLHKA
jgi:predicted ATP-grasp superfamily ATP-dependent carboligase